MNTFQIGDRVEHVDHQPGYVGVIHAIAKSTITNSDQYTYAIVDWPNARGDVFIKHLKHADPKPARTPKEQAAIDSAFTYRLARKYRDDDPSNPTPDSSPAYPASIGIPGHSGAFAHLRPHVATYKPAKPDSCPGYYWFHDVEVKQISRHLTSNGGQALQYIARATRLDGANKGEHVKDLTKARDFIQDEITRLEGKQA